MTEPIPIFHVYGEPARALDLGFVHVETVMARGTLHQGRVRPHKHDRMGQIMFWTAGGGRYVFDDRILDFSAPALTFIPSGIVHGFDVDAGSDAICISLADDALAAIGAFAQVEVGTPAMVIAETQNPVWSHLRQLFEIALATYQAGTAHMETMIGALAAAALVECERLRRAGPPSAQEHSLAAALRQLVDVSFRKDWPVERYAAALQVSPWRLTQACRKAFGLPVKDIISARRLLEAKRLLLFTVRPVQDIAAEIGIDDPAYFSRFFHEKTGESPSRWRRREARRLQGAPEAAGAAQRSA